MCMRNPRWLFEIHSARACWGIDIWNRWRVLLDWYFVRPRWKNVCEKMYVYAHTKYWMPSQPFEDEIVWTSMIHIEWLSLLYISYGFWFDVGGNKGSVLLILCCCWTCGCTMNEEEISMKNIEYFDLLLYCTIESLRQCMDFQDHYWIKIIGIMIVWDSNDWRTSATTSENWEEHLFSGETSFFLPNYVSTRNINRSIQ